MLHCPIYPVVQYIDQANQGYSAGKHIDLRG